MKHSPAPEENSCSGDSKHETKSSSTSLSAQCLISVTHLLLQLLKSPLRREDRHLHTAKTSVARKSNRNFYGLFYDNFKRFSKPMREEKNQNPSCPNHYKIVSFSALFALVFLLRLKNRARAIQLTRFLSPKVPGKVQLS